MSRITSLMVIGWWLAGSCLVEGAAAPVDRFEWSATSNVPAGASVQVVPGGAENGEDALRITGTPGQPSTRLLLDVQDPAVDAEIYAFEGRIRYEDVEGAGYLELWNEFPNGERYFSRTFAESGPRAAITGSSDWRTFSVPFNRSGTEQPPRRLELYVILPGDGTVHIGPAVLKEISAAGSGPPPFAFVWAPWALGAIVLIVGAVVFAAVFLVRRG